jgi:hypothetical protein
MVEPESIQCRVRGTKNGAEDVIFLFDKRSHILRTGFTMYTVQVHSTVLLRIQKHCKPDIVRIIIFAWFTYIGEQMSFN